MSAPSHEELTQRQSGLYTPEQQERIRSMVVAVAGCGALGAPAAYYLARLGVAELRLADPEEFEPSNVNRQYGAYLDTIGVNKADAVAGELRRVSPDLRLKTFTDGVTGDCVAEFLDGADVVIDGIDFFTLEIELMLHREARRRGLWIFTSPGVSELSSTTVFDPSREDALVQMTCENGEPSMAKAISSFFPVLPAMATPELLNAAISGDLPFVPADITGAVHNGAFAVDDVIRVAVRGLPPHAVAPDVYLLNADELWLRVWDAARQDWRTE